MLQFRSGASVRGGLFALLALLAWAATAPAQRGLTQYGDPVEDLRHALVNRATNRVAQIRAAIQSLKSISDLQRALALPDWTGADQSFRRQIGQQFQDRVNASVKSANATTRLAAAALLGDVGTTIPGFDIPGSVGLGTSLMGVLGAPLGADPFLAWDLILGRADVPAISSRSGLMRSFTPQLLTLLTDPDPRVRQMAARSLGRINPEPQVAVPALKKLLKSSQVEDRRAAAEGLYSMIQVVSQLQRTAKGAATEGIEASQEEILAVGTQVVNAVHPGLADEDLVVRRVSTLAIQKAAGALGLFIPQPLKSEDLATAAKAYTQTTLANFQPFLTALKNQGPPLARLLRDADPQVQLTARRTLVEISQVRLRLRRVQASLAPPANVKPPRREALRRRDGLRTVRFQNQQADADPLGQALLPAVDILKKGISGADVADRLTSIEFLELLEDAAASAAPVLIEAMTDPNKFVRWAAARALSKTGPIDRETMSAALPALKRMLADPDVDLRVVAATTLAQFGPLAVDAVPALTRAAQAGDGDNRIAAMRTLTVIGLGQMKSATADEVIAAVTANLANDNTRVRVAAAETLGRFGPPAQAAVPALRKALADEEIEVRRIASEALIDIGGH